MDKENQIIILYYAAFAVLKECTMRIIDYMLLVKKVLVYALLNTIKKTEKKY